ncbi:hypothetical protein D3C86_1360090 [compost metagenome]
MTQRVDGIEEGRVKSQPLSVNAVRHPVVAFTVQHPFEAGLEKLRDTPGIGIQVFGQQRQGNVAAAVAERIATTKCTVPLTDHCLLPLRIEAFGRRGKHLLPGLLHGVHKHRLTKTTPLLAEAGGNQAAVVTGFGQVDRLALEHRLGNSLGHGLRVGRIGHLLQTQTHLRHPGQIRLEALGLGSGATLVHQRQGRAKGRIQRPLHPGALVNRILVIPTQQVFRRFHQ